MDQDPAIRELLTHDSFRKLRDGVHYVYASAVPGDIVEFGTGWGRTAYVMAASMAAYAQMYRRHQEAHGIGARVLHLFDSFCGLPLPESQIDLVSPHVVSGFWGESKCTGMSEAELVRNCEKYIPSGRLKVYAGWFKDTLPQIREGTKFSLVHVDCDLYESARDVLDHLFRNDCFADGCALFFDDWHCNRASPDHGERRAWRECVEKYSPRYSDCGEYGIVGWKFILHK
jgi:hypothetical protein